MNEFDFESHEIIEIPVKGPDGKLYILREASGDSTSRFNTARAQCMKFQDGSVSGVDGQGRLEILLVSLCLFNTKDDGEINLQSTPSVGTLGQWPGPIITKLFNKAKEISEIDLDDLENLKKQYEELGKRIAQMEADMAKNEPKPTETG